MSPRLRNGERVAIRHDGEVVVHAAEGGVGGGYDTLCGVDGDDTAIGLSRAPLPVGARIGCGQCKAIFLQATRYTRKDFA